MPRAGTRGSLPCKHAGTEARWSGGTEARRHGGTEAQRHRGTEAQRHKGTEAQRHRGTEARRSPRVRRPHLRKRTAGTKTGPLNQRTAFAVQTPRNRRELAKEPELKARRHGGTEARRHGGTEARRHGGTVARRHRGTEARRHGSTEARKHGGTEAQRHGGTEARTSPRVRRPYKGRIVCVTQLQMRRSGPLPIIDEAEFVGVVVRNFNFTANDGKAAYREIPKAT
eukprot:SAG11_NODE_2815_length_2945_cov_9.976793_2_plen_226_part_00